MFKWKLFTLIFIFFSLQLILWGRIVQRDEAEVAANRWVTYENGKRQLRFPKENLSFKSIEPLFYNGEQGDQVMDVLQIAMCGAQPL
jgi:hypothetical protein